MHTSRFSAYHGSVESLTVCLVPTGRTAHAEGAEVLGGHDVFSPQLSVNLKFI
jgi:hypothetical protein